ncbi:hypothetical protein K438DRAFT_1780071 [Mycena galopus ATCC 62051]|nr:hypothetical protein K438DRAFT_1780071 [Mycena galopus ATCC 62051]
MWDHFHKGKIRQNTSHWKTHCKGCVKHEQKLLQDAGTCDSVDWQAEGQSFWDGSLPTCWVTHILGGKDAAACVHASAAAWKEATALQDATFAVKQTTRAAAPGGTSKNSPPLSHPATTSGRKHDRSASASDDPQPKRLKQGTFQVYSGKDQPFITAEAAELRAQALRATGSQDCHFGCGRTEKSRNLSGFCGQRALSGAGNSAISQGRWWSIT